MSYQSKFHTPIPTPKATISAKDLAVKNARELCEYISSRPDYKELLPRLVEGLTVLAMTDSLEELPDIYKAYATNEYLSAALAGIKVCPQEMINDFDAMCGAADVLRNYRLNIASALEHAIENPEDSGPVRDFFRELPEENF